MEDAPPRVAQPGRLSIAHGDGPFIRQENACDQVEQGRLAGTARADQGDLLAVGHGEPGHPQGKGRAAVMEGELLDGNHIQNLRTLS